MKIEAPRVKLAKEVPGHRKLTREERRRVAEEAKKVSESIAQKAAALEAVTPEDLMIIVKNRANAAFKCEENAI